MDINYGKLIEILDYSGSQLKDLSLVVCTKYHLSIAQFFALLYKIIDWLKNMSVDGVIFQSQANLLMRQKHWNI